MDYGQNAHLNTNFIQNEDKNKIDPHDFGVSRKYHLAHAKQRNSKTFL